jgi:tetratricopeptide (TPR) repeat protein
MKKLVILILVCFSTQILMAQKNVAVYWDASYSMKDRDMDRELKFLENYFNKHTEANVTLAMFSNEILLKDYYKVEDGKWIALKRDLENTIYDGATSFKDLFRDDADEYLLFTDGIENMDNLNPPTNKPIHVISSLDHADRTNLKLVTDLSAGRFIYLSTDYSTEVIEKKEAVVKDEEVDDGYVTGNVSSFEGNLPNVSIVNQTSNGGTSSDTMGNYKIKADEGDILIFSNLGKKTVSVRVNKTDVINISMADIKENLDEVILIGEAEKEEMVNTGNTMVNEKSLGYSIESITDEEISELDTDVQQAVKGQFANFILPNDSAIDDVDLSQFLGRGRNMSILLNQYGLLVIDGVPQEQSVSEFGGFRSRSVSTMNPDLIASITYLKGLAATNKYGTQGRNGVLLITTKSAQIAESIETPEQKPLGTTLTYSGNAEDIENLPNTSYIKILKQSKTVEDAFNNYLAQRDSHGTSPTFYLDVYEYFKGWNNPIMSNRILSNIYEVAYDNVTALKALAYKQQSSGDFLGAQLTFERLLKLEPGNSQSYRNLALAYSYAGQYQKALDLYKRIENNVNVGNANFSGINRTIFNETKNLISQNKNELNTLGIDKKFLRPIKYKSRIIFEWNDLDAEFDLNIINPQNRFFTWSHTQAENSQRILQQHQQGYGLEEFYLTEHDLGEWKFNMKYYGKTTNDKTPTFIKITTYKNYGSPNQTKTINVVRLDQKQIEQTVTKLVVN